MSGLGTIVNIIAICVGTFIGLFFKKFITQKLKDSLVQALGLATMSIGILGVISGSMSISGDSLSSNYSMIMILSLVIGTFIGEFLDIELQLDRLGKFCEKRFISTSSNSTFSQAFVTASLIFCVGSMAIVGSLNDGILHNPDILFAKSMLDGVFSIIFASTMGIGVMLSAVTVFVYQGSITLCASFLSSFLTDAVIAQMSFVGSILIVAIGINFLRTNKLKVGNMLPSVFIPLIWYAILQLVK